MKKILYGYIIIIVMCLAFLGCSNEIEIDGTATLEIVVEPNTIYLRDMPYDIRAMVKNTSNVIWEGSLHSEIQYYYNESWVVVCAPIVVSIKVTIEPGEILELCMLVRACSERPEGWLVWHSPYDDVIFPAGRYRFAFGWNTWSEWGGWYGEFTISE